MDVRQLEVVLTRSIPVARVHQSLKASQISWCVAFFRYERTIVLCTDRRPFLAIVITLLYEVCPTTTGIIRHFQSIVYVSDRSLQTNVVRFSSFPVVYKVWSNRSCTPSLTEGECLSIVLTTADTEVKGNTIGITDSGLPRSQLIKLDREQCFWIDCIIILHPCQSLTFGIRIVFNHLIISISPQRAEVVNQFITRIVHTIINVGNNILFGQCCSIGQLNRCQWFISCAYQISKRCTIAIHTSIIEPCTAEHCLCSILVNTSVSTFLSWQQFTCIAQILQNLSPQNFYITLRRTLLVRTGNQRNISIHGRQLIIIEST